MKARAHGGCVCINVPLGTRFSKSRVSTICKSPGLASPIRSTLLSSSSRISVGHPIPLRDRTVMHVNDWTVQPKSASHRTCPDNVLASCFGKIVITRSAASLLGVGGSCAADSPPPNEFGRVALRTRCCTQKLGVALTPWLPEHGSALEVGLLNREKECVCVCAVDYATGALKIQARIPSGGQSTAMRCTRLYMVGEPCFSDPASFTQDFGTRNLRHLNPEARVKCQRLCALTLSTLAPTA